MKEDNMKIEQRLQSMKKFYISAGEMIDGLPDAIPEKTREMLKDNILGDKDLKKLMDGIDSHRPPRIFLIGRTGVGKSSLINALLPESAQSVNIISENSKLGQHTTTTSRLLPFNPDDLTQGGIVDTPGIREYGIWHLTPDDIISGFVELAPLAGDCQFRDCRHTHNSKGCALWQAVADGVVLQRRVENLVTLREEAATKPY